MSEVNQTPEQTPAATPAASTRQMSFTPLEDGTVKAEFGPGLEPLIFSPALAPEKLLPEILTEGVIARLRGYTSKLTGDDRTPAALRAQVAKGIENIFEKGLWKIEREAGEGGSAISIEAEAAWVFRTKRAAVQSKEYTETLAEAAAAFGALSDEQKAKLKAVPLYAVSYAEVKARRMAENAAKMAAKLAKKAGEVAPETPEDDPF